MFNPFIVQGKLEVSTETFHFILNAIWSPQTRHRKHWESHVTLKTFKVLNNFRFILVKCSLQGIILNFGLVILFIYLLRLIYWIYPLWNLSYN